MSATARHRRRSSARSSSSAAARPAWPSATSSPSRAAGSPSSKPPASRPPPGGRRWDSLRLFTPVRYDSLPGLAFPGDPDSYPSRDDVVAYLTDYARRFELPVEFNSRVQAVRARDGGGFLVELADRTLRGRPGRGRHRAVPGAVHAGRWPPTSAPRSCSCTAASTAPRTTSRRARCWWSAAATPATRSARSSCASRQVHLAIGARQMPLPQRILGRDLFRYLEATGLMRKTVNSRLGAAAEGPRDAHRLQPARRAQAGHPAAAARDRGSRPRRHLRRRLRARGRRRGVGDRLPARPLLRASCPSSTTDGQLRHQRGVTDVPGLYFLGLALAAHPRLGAAGLGQGRRAVHRRAHRRVRRPHRPRGAHGRRAAMTATTAATRGRGSPRSAHAGWRSAGSPRGLVAIAFAAVLPDDVAYVYLGAQLAGIGWVYFGFGVADGRLSSIAVEVLSASAFLTLGFLGAYHQSTVVLGLGFLAHGGVGLAASRRARPDAHPDVVPAVLRGRRRGHRRPAARRLGAVRGWQLHSQSASPTSRSPPHSRRSPPHSGRFEVGRGLRTTEPRGILRGRSARCRVSLACRDPLRTIFLPSPR